MNQMEKLELLAENLGLDKSQAKTIKRFIVKNDVFGVKSLKSRIKKLKEINSKFVRCEKCKGKGTYREWRWGNYGEYWCEECDRTGYKLKR